MDTDDNLPPDVCYITKKFVRSIIKNVFKRMNPLDLITILHFATTESNINLVNKIKKISHKHFQYQQLKWMAHLSRKENNYDKHDFITPYFKQKIKKGRFHR